jgi:hypothetical protein
MPLVKDPPKKAHKLNHLFPTCPSLTDFNTIEVGCGVPSSHICIIVDYGGFIGT